MGDGLGHWEQVAKLRALEPTGLLKLAAAQIHEKQWDKASRTVHQLKSTAWPARFADVAHQASELERQIEAGRPK